MSDTIAKSGISTVATRAGARVETRAAPYGSDAGWEVISSYGDADAELAAARERVALADVSAVGKLVIQGRGIEAILKDTFSVSPGAPTELAIYENGWITKMNRYEYYAVLPLDQLEATVERLHTVFDGMHAHVTAVTHGRDALALVGPYAGDTLSKLCALDLHARIFPDRCAQISSVAGVTTLIARLDRAGVRCYELHLDRSYGAFLWETILDAAEEFGGRMIGMEAFTLL